MYMASMSWACRFCSSISMSGTLSVRCPSATTSSPSYVLVMFSLSMSSSLSTLSSSFLLCSSTTNTFHCFTGERTYRWLGSGRARLHG
jgi:hypothetical protein